MAELIQTQMEAILDPDSQHPFQTFISDLRSSSEEQKAEAKSMFNIIKHKDPQSFAIKLSNCLAAPNSDFGTREKCAAHIRKLLTDEDDTDLITWHNRLTVFTQSKIKSILLDSIKLEQDSKFVIQELCNTVYKLAISILPDNNWPELLPFFIQCLSDPTSNIFLKQLVFSILGGLSFHIGKTISPCVKPLHSLFWTTLNDNTLHLDLRIRATRAVIRFILYVPASSDEKQRFQELLPGVMSTLTDTLSNGDKAKDVLGDFIDMAKKDPKFFRLQLTDVVYSMLEIAEDEKFEMRTRHLAIEFVLSLVEAREKAPGMMKNLPLFTHTCFAILLNMLVDIKDEPSWYSADYPDEQGVTENHIFGRVCLKRFSIALGGKTVYHVAMEQLGDYLLAPEWEKHHAALDALYQILKGSSKVMRKYLQQPVDMVLCSFQHPHPRVKWGALCVIGQFPIYFSPLFQEQYHNQVLPALAEAMDDSENPRMQARATWAVHSFCKHGTQATVLSYLDKLLNKLLVLLQNDNQMVLEAAFKALYNIVLLSKEHFQKYYDIVFPYLKTILVNANDKSNHNLLRGALECITFVWLTVEKEKFRDDLKQVMEMLTLLQESQVKELETILYILWACGRICISIRKDFLPYMSKVMPPLIECAQLELDKTVPSYKVYEHIHKVKIGDAIICVRGSDLLSAKSGACDLLGGFAYVLEEDFYPWKSQAASIFVPLLKFYINDSVREKACYGMYKLLRSAKLAVEKGTAQGGNLSYFKQLSHDIMMAFGDAIYSEPKTKICALMLQELNRCLEICESLLNLDEAYLFIDGIKHVIRESSRRKGEFIEIAKSEDFDAEDAELLREETELEDQVFRNVGGILMTLIKTFKASFLPFLDELSSYLMPMMGKDKTAEERTTSLRIFEELLLQCGEATLKYYDICLPFLLDACNDDSPNIREVALYGLWLSAIFGGYAFKPFIKEALSRINVVITHFNALEPENIWAYCLAIGAFGEICKSHRKSINSALIIPTWLNCLPIKLPHLNSKKVHDQLCSMVERLDKDLLGPNYLHIPKVVSVFAEVLCAGDNLATEETAKRMINLLRHFQKTIQPAIWASAWLLLLPQQEMELESLLSAEEDVTSEPIQ